MRIVGDSKEDKDNGDISDDEDINTFASQRNKFFFF